jgi:hypothetical protein
MTALLPALVLAACVPHLTSPADTGPEDTAWVPPENTWPSAMPPADLEATGMGEGQVPPDFRMDDQFGDAVSLWQFYGLVVVLDLSTMTCVNCQALAPQGEAMYREFGDQGFLYATVLSEDTDGDVPDVKDLGRWVGYFDITAPVLSDDQGYTQAATGAELFPWIIVIDRTMRIAEDEVVPADDDTIRSVVAGLL